MTEPAQVARRPQHIVISTRAIRSGSGSSRIVLALVRGLRAAGHHVDVVADRIAAGAVRRAGGRPRYPLGLAPLQSLGRNVLSREQQLAWRDRAVRHLHADIVIGDGDLLCQDVVLVHNVLRREVEELGAAATAEHEQAAAAQERSLRTNVWRLAVAPSELARREFVRCFGSPSPQVAVVYPGFDPAQFSLSARESGRAATRQALGIAPDDIVVAFISSGHFTLRGLDVLADTFRQLTPASRRRVRLLCVGSERNTGLLRDEFTRGGLDQPLMSAPRIEEVENYYYAADLLFHPAHFETFGLVLLEAVACGTPVVTSRSAGASELFRDTGALTVTARPDAALFAPLLARLLADQALCRAIAATQYHAVKHLTWQAYARNFTAVLEHHPAAIES